MVEIEADDSEYAEDNLNIEAIKAAVGELTDSECEALYKTLTALEKEAEEMESKIQAAEEEAKKALEEYEKEQAKLKQAIPACPAVLFFMFIRLRIFFLCRQAHSL